ncbi:MAG: malate synthase G [Acidimicrobiaceae bacterium]|nr:malate synthase G [Acidimicrobiaceae bacterium]
MTDLQPPTRQSDFVEGLQVDPELHRFIDEEALPGTGIDPAVFWRGLAELIERYSGRNRELLERRAELQSAIDSWHLEHRDAPHDASAYRSFLESIGYLQPAGPDFEIDPNHVDPEIATIAGPQLVVPVTIARYALNAANARWVSLYDALYGTDALGDLPEPGPYDPARGARVVAWVRTFLDRAVPLGNGSHADAVGYRVADGRLEVTLGGQRASGPADPTAFAGYRGDPDAPTAVLLRHHGLHIELVIDRKSEVGAGDPAGISDVVMEAAVTTIVDFEDSVATVDAADKVAAYRNWLGLMKGDLEVTFDKGGRELTRRLAADQVFQAPDGTAATLPGRALLLVRNVGHLIMTDAVLDADGQQIPEGFLDALITVTIALHDVRRPLPTNSRAGSVYVVKPKMHGPAEVAFFDEVLGHVEAVLGLEAGTVKIGLMDEERRTSVNLKECIRAARTRIAFINTGFLDRTGDEIHTSMEAGPMVRKGAMRAERFLSSYEEHNVNVGLACGLRGRAQIGKGMWTAADRMGQMLAEKIGHPKAGANCAWVPSPTAAALHATHYHEVDVAAVQEGLIGRSGPTLEGMLTLPLARPPAGEPLASEKTFSAEEIRSELDNNAQGILGYLVRWIDQGVGCSKVPDINDVALMEDRATCRISSQHIANWLHHGIVDRDTVIATMKRMAEVVDRQNAGDPHYVPMAPAYTGEAFQGACELVLEGVEQPSGYTEPIVHARRRREKAIQAKEI